MPIEKFNINKLKQEIENRIRTQRKENEFSNTDSAKIFIGYSLQEIKEVMEAQGVSALPQIYQEFLQEMGHHAGDIFLGADVNFAYLKLLKKHLEDVLTDGRNRPNLSSDEFVFFSYQTVNFFFFKTHPKIDDPPVYYYADGMAAFIQLTEKLSDWLEKQLLYPTGPYGWVLDHKSKEIQNARPPQDIQNKLPDWLLDWKP